MKRIDLWLLLVATLGLGVSCGSGEDLVEPVVPGNLTVNLSTPYTDDGALLLTIGGPVPPTAISARAGLRLFMSSASPTTKTKLVVTGPITAGAILTLMVPDVKQASEFVGSVQEGASSSFAVRPLADYALSVDQ